MTNFAISFLFVSIVALFIFVFFSILNYKNRFKMNYDLRNHYPYELNFESKFSDNLTGNIGIILFGICSTTFYSMYNSNFNNGFLIFILIAGSIYSVVLASLVFIPLKSLKLHLGVVLVSVVLSFLIPFANAMACSMHFKSYNDVFSLILIIVNAIYCLYIFILMINPKLSHWADLKVEVAEDGTKKYIRPKVFILAFIEWSLILSSPILMVLSLLVNYAIN